MKDILKRYPRTLLPGLRVRPLEKGDEESLLRFFKTIPVEERQLFKDDVTKPKVIKGWMDHLDYGNILPLLALDGDRIVADATLHRDRRGWSRHVAKIRLTLDPEYRGRGIARALIQEFIEIAARLQVAVLHAETLDSQKGGRALFDSLGFLPVATLPQHAIDFAGRVHDIVISTFTVTPPEKIAAEISLTEGDADTGGG